MPERTSEISAHRQTSSRPVDLPEIPAGGRPLLTVLSAPSAAGKDAVRDILIGWDLPVYFCVTATTRPPRPGEVNGADYHFLSEEAFDRLEAENGFIEHATVYGRRYGVPRDEVASRLERREDVVARVDVQGAATLKALYPEA